MSAILFAILINQCGVRFSAPDGWRSALAANDNDAVVCKIDLKPPQWASAKPRWGPVPPYPVRVVLFAASASGDDAVDEMGFEKDDQGRIGFYGFQGHFDDAQPFKAGNLSGVQSTPFYRGFIDDESLLHGDESRVFTASQRHVLAQTPGGRRIGIECDSGTPDDHVDCDAVISLVAQTLKEGPVTGQAKGTFEVKLMPEPLSYDAGHAPLARMSIEKHFHGELEGKSSGEMLSAGSGVKGSAGYVAIERVAGTLAGRKGTFILQHSATMNRGTPSLSITVVPDSGTGELVGLTGKMNIIIEGHEHSYEFDYALP